MKNPIINLVFGLGLLCAFNPRLSTCLAQGTAFTYQGNLTQTGQPANAPHDFEFRLFDAATGGAQQGPTVTLNDVGVTNGLFLAPLDFGANFPGADRFLQIAVRPGDSTGSYTTLTPRQPLTPTPYALTAGNVTGVIPGGSLAGTYPGAVTLSNPNNAIAGTFTGNGAGLTNLNAVTLGSLTASNFWQTTGNAGTTPGLNFLGTSDNQALELRANNLPALRVRPQAGDAPSLIGGSSSNSIAPSTPGAVIAGGGDGSSPNIITSPGRYAAIGGGKRNLTGGDFSVVSGGSTNQALDAYTTVSGGSANIARFAYDTVGGGGGNEAAGVAATVAGGWDNRASATMAFIGGGEFNEATGHSAVIGGGASNDAGDFATVAGGWLNRAAGTNSTIGGGKDNQASGNYSFVGGGTNNAAGGLHSVIGGGAGNSISTVFSRGATIAGGSANIIGSQALSSTIGGGSGNEIRTYSQWSVIAGGSGNASAEFATRAVISGGQQNRVTGSYGTIPGGYSNEATNLAFAAGVAAKAIHEGAWVWADGGAGDLLSPDFASTRTNQFLVRASGAWASTPTTRRPRCTCAATSPRTRSALRAPASTPAPSPSRTAQ